MKLILLLVTYFILSCTLKKEEVKKIAISDWDIFENSISQNWNNAKLKEILGEPKKISTKANNSTWFYFNSRTGYQEWAFEITNSGLVESVTYLPVTNDPEFSLEKIEKHWMSYKCLKKFLPSNIPHVVKNEEYLSCDNGKRNAYYNRYIQVNSLSIEK